ncbi:hypothetical protein TNCV_4812511 [Trichonephila clavipes]|nr:hypothetical protein TNCV_4812511 [Trichonephila clavipes]
MYRHRHPSYTIITTHLHCHGTLQKCLLKSNACGLVRGYDGFEIGKSSPQTTAVPGDKEVIKFRTAPARSQKTKVPTDRPSDFVALRTIASNVHDIVSHVMENFF